MAQQWALTVAGRYSGKMYTTLDNADVNPNTYQGFGAWFVADARANYRVDRHWSAGARRRQRAQPEVLPVPPVPAADVRGESEVRVVAPGSGPAWEAGPIDPGCVRWPEVPRHEAFCPWG